MAHNRGILVPGITENNMALSTVGTSSYSDINNLNNRQTSSSVTRAATTGSTAAAGNTATTGTGATTPGANNSSLSSAVNQALAQLNAGGDLSTLLSPQSQQSSSDFLSSLISSLPGLESSNTSSSDPLASLFGSSGQTVVPVTLDQSSSTIKLQQSIQNLIGQLDGADSSGNLLGIAGGSGSGAGSSLQDLQQSFNDLITSSSGNPSDASLQSFLKLVAANVQASTSIGNLFDANA